MCSVTSLASIGVYYTDHGRAMDRAWLEAGLTGRRQRLHLLPVPHSRPGWVVRNADGSPRVLQRCGGCGKYDGDHVIGCGAA